MVYIGTHRKCYFRET